MRCSRAWWMITEEITAWGHENVLSLHKNTFEFTAEDHLTIRGDCIFAVKADKTMADLSDEFKQALRREGARLKIKIECNGITDEASAYGHPGLILTHKSDFVVRKSTFICERTLAVNADKAASDISRKLVEELKKADKAVITLTVD